VSAPFRQYFWRHLVTNLDLLTSICIRHSVLFHMVWSVTTYDCWIFVGGYFFLFSLLPDKMHDCPFYFLFFNFSLCSFDFLFHFYSFYRSFVFQFSPSSIISHIFFFISVLLLLILIYFLEPFVKFFFLLSISSFNHIFCCFIFFSIWPSLFCFFC
jgi:hypothetical protein